MSPETKIVISTFAVFACAIALYANWKPGPDWLWRLGKKDPLRNAIFQSDGSLRRFAKPTLVLIVLVWLLMLWLVAPMYS